MRDDDLERVVRRMTGPQRRLLRKMGDGQERTFARGDVDFYLDALQLQDAQLLEPRRVSREGASFVITLHGHAAALLSLSLLTEEDDDECGDERARLWAHCVSEHAVILSPETTFYNLREYHDHEHEGPGTLRDHDQASRHYSLRKIGLVLSEAEVDS